MKVVLKRILILCLFVFLFLCLFAYAATPYLVRHFAKQPLSELGLALDGKSQVRYNLLTSTLTIRNFALLDTEQSIVAAADALKVNMDLLPLLFKRIHVEEVLFDGGFLLVEAKGDQLIIAGVDLSALPSEETEAEPAQHTEPSPYKATLAELIISDFELSALVDRGSEESNSHQFYVDELNLNDLAFDVEQQKLSLEIKGHLDQANFALGAELSFENQLGEVELDIELEDLALANYVHFIPDENVELEGQLSIAASPTVSLAEGNIQVALSELSLDLDQVQAGFSPWRYIGEKHAIRARDISLSVDTVTSEVSVETNIEAEFLNGLVSLGAEENVLAAWDAIRLDPKVAIAGEDQTIDVSRFEVAQIKLSELLNAEGSNPMAEIESLLVNDIRFAENHLSISEVVVTEGSAQVHVLDDKTINHLIDFSSLPDDSEPEAQLAEENVAEVKVPTDEVSVAEVAAEESATSSGQPPATMSIGAIRLDSPFVVNVTDESVSPAYEQVFSIEELELGELDTRAPESTTPFRVSIKDDEYFAVGLSGGVKPFGERLDAEIGGQLTELTLTEISPYMKDALGFEMKSGQLDIDIEIAIEQDELSGDVRLDMRGLEMTKADQYEQGFAKEGQAMPLNAALDMLKDGNGNIALNVPMSGSIDDPSFGMSSFIGLVLKKAAMNQAKNYLVQTFIPYSNVVTVVMSGADYLMQLRLEPLVYQTAQVEISSEQEVYLGELILLLGDKPDVQVKTCAVVLPADIGLAQLAELSEEQTQTLLTLGENRQQQLKSYLVNQGGIASSRILACASEIDRSEDVSPRIELNTE